MIRTTRLGLGAVALGLALLPATAQKETSFTTSKDNTLWNDPAGGVSNGKGRHFFVGSAAELALHQVRRGLIGFDIAGNVPAGATITSVELTLTCSMTISGPQTVTLHRVTSDWGEGDSAAGGMEGTGAPALPGDATWLHTFFATDFWTTAGGDFDAAASASLDVGFSGVYTWTSTPELVADVQFWLDNPGSDFGWILLGNETDLGTAKRFDTHENEVPSSRPRLTVQFTGGDPGVTYCEAKDGLTCGLPAISFSGTPSASATSGFVVSAGPARGLRSGLILYSASGRASIPFQGGTLCVSPPFRRAIPANSGGTSGQCDGTFALDMNAFAQGQAGGNPDPFLLIVDQRVDAQWWGRDSIATGSFLSDGAEYFVGP